MGLDELVPHDDSLAKKAVAFFTTTRQRARNPMDSGVAATC
jgi:hypothetical protein